MKNNGSLVVVKYTDFPDRGYLIDNHYISDDIEEVIKCLKSGRVCKISFMSNVKFVPEVEAAILSRFRDSGIKLINVELATSFFNEDEGDDGVSPIFSPYLRKDARDLLQKRHANDF